MQKWMWIGMLLGLTGCDQVSTMLSDVTTKVAEGEYIQPCITVRTEAHEGGYRYVPTGEKGFQHMQRQGDRAYTLTHCLPCSEAMSTGEKFTCQGDEGRTTQ